MVPIRFLTLSIRTLTLAICALFITLTVVIPVGSLAFAQGGSVGGGGGTPTYPQPNGVSALYIYSFNDTEGGPVSVSLLHDNGSGTIQTDANGDGYAPAAPDGTYPYAGFYESYCPSPNSHIYVVVRGYTINGVYNAALNEVVFIPTTCSQFDNFSSFSINEATTVAAVYGLAQTGFTLTPSDHLAGPPLGYQNIDNAFNYAANFVDAVSGNVLTQTPTGGATVPTAEINTLANIMASCTYSGSGASGSDCTNLFAAATPSGGAAPVDSFQAMYEVVEHPTNNVAALYALSGSQPLLQPALTSAPANWSVSLGFPDPLATTGAITINGSSLTVAVEDANGIAPTGTVSCTATDSSNNVTSIGSATLADGAATLTVPSIPNGYVQTDCSYTPSGPFNAIADIPGISVGTYKATLTVSYNNTLIYLNDPLSTPSVNVTLSVAPPANSSVVFGDLTGVQISCNGANVATLGTINGGRNNGLTATGTATLSFTPPTTGSYSVSCSTPSPILVSGHSVVGVSGSASTTVVNGAAPTNAGLNWLQDVNYGLYVGGVAGRQGPTAAVYNGSEYVAYTSPNNPFGDQDGDQYIYFSSPIGVPYSNNYRTPTLINSQTGNAISDANPALLTLTPADVLYHPLPTAPQNPLILAVNGEERHLISGWPATFQFNEATGAWTLTGNQFIPTPLVDYSPAIASDGTYLYMGLRNAGDHTLILCRELISQINGDNAGSASCQNFPNLWYMNFNPALGIVKDGTQSVLVLGIEEYEDTHELRVFTSIDQGLSFQQNTDITANGGDQTSTAPFFVNFNGLLYIGFRTNDSDQKFLYRATQDGFHWTTSMDPHYAMGSAPALIDGTNIGTTPGTSVMYNFFSTNDGNYTLMQWGATIP